MTSELLTLPEASSIYKIAVQTFYRYKCEKRWPGVFKKLGGKLLIDRAELEKQIKG